MKSKKQNMPYDCPSPVTKHYGVINVTTEIREMFEKVACHESKRTGYRVTVPEVARVAICDFAKKLKVKL